MRAGDIVRATAGKDKEKVFLVLSVDETDALIAEVLLVNSSTVLIPARFKQL